MPKGKPAKGHRRRRHDPIETPTRPVSKKRKEAWRRRTAIVVLRHIARGLPDKWACAAACISPKTWLVWKRDYPDLLIRRNEIGEPVTLEMAEHQAAAGFVSSHIARVSRAGKEPRHWVASLAILSRRHPEFRESKQIDANVGLSLLDIINRSTELGDKDQDG